MYTPVIAAPGMCLDSDYINDVYENLTYFRDCARTNQQQFVCKAINMNQGSAISAVSSELCFTVQDFSDTTNPIGGAEIVQKMLLFSWVPTTIFSNSDSSNPGMQTVQRSIRILCNDVTIQTLTPAQTGALITSAFFKCPSNAKIDICFDTVVKSTGQAGFATGTQGIQVCGSLVCISDVENKAIGNFFVPPAIDKSCCYGREAIHLALQNLTSLRTAFTEFGQIPTCQALTFNDDNNHVIINTAPTQTDFLIVGQIEVCASNNSSYYDAQVNAKPNITCGQTNIECLDYTAVVNRGLNGQPGTTCLTVPVVACGRCEKGDNLIVSIRSQFVCNESASELVAGGNGIEEVEQHYCVYLFSRIETDFGDDLSGSLDKCIDFPTFQAISSSMDQINEVCELQEEITLTTRRRQGVGEHGDCVIFQEAQPWPPLNDPTNTDPVPIKKWFVIGRVAPCIRSLSGRNTERVNRVRGNAEMFCGGTSVDRQTVSWQATGSGFVSRCGPAMTFLRCVECPIDEDMSVCFEGAQPVGFGLIPNEFTYNFELFCF